MCAFFPLQQLTDALLAMEEEKAIWFAREKATVEAINEKAKSYSAEIATLITENDRGNLQIYT